MVTSWDSGLYGARMLVRRLKSWLVDYLLILAWLVVIAVVVGLPSLSGWFNVDRVWADRASTDIAITLLTVVPLFIYLTLTESGSTHSTYGKRRGGIEVTRSDGSEVGSARVAVRNLVKVLPWQLGHMGSVRLATGEAEGLGMALNVAALMLVAAVAVPPIAGRRGLHDVTAGTTVSSSR